MDDDIMPSQRDADRAPSSARAKLELCFGAIHAFVDLPELRRVMGQLAATELIRLLLGQATPATAL